jgi:hypothetical protein
VRPGRDVSYRPASRYQIGLVLDGKRGPSAQRLSVGPVAAPRREEMVGACGRVGVGRREGRSGAPVSDRTYTTYGTNGSVSLVL